MFCKSAIISAAYTMHTTRVVSFELKCRLEIPQAPTYHTTDTSPDHWDLLESSLSAEYL
jgi:hypothetical protein